ncbi:MAG TPA: hypothetical protein VFX25_37545 [Streptosporangiaceae bacterium]|nr:hypothetical protein [Streptosporangiaceae bacterium]
MDLAAAEDWIRGYVRPSGALEVFRERPWASVVKVPVARGIVWLKACAAVQDFEPALTAGLSARWPDRIAEVLAVDRERSWLLMADAGPPVSTTDMPAAAWAEALPQYAELQRGEIPRVADHLAAGVPDLRLATWPARYQDLLSHDLPLTAPELGRLRRFAPRFTQLCGELASWDIPDSIQHDDLHMGSLHRQGARLRFLDWGDASVSHPFASLVVTFRFLEEAGRRPPGDPAYGRLRDAYLQSWGADRAGAFRPAIRAGAFAHAFAWARQRDALPGPERPGFDQVFAVILRRALAGAGAYPLG